MGSVSPDISRIRALIASARRRLRAQWALEGATTAVVLGSAVALAAVYAVRSYVIAPSTGIAVILGSLGVVAVGAILGALRRVDDELIARRIDRASNLSDRLSTAVAFDRALRRETILPGEDPETQDLMRAAIRDGVQSAARADVRRATPFRKPKDASVAAVFAGVAILAALMGLPDRDPDCFAVTPLRAAHGDPIQITGEWLCGPEHPATHECTSINRMVIFRATEQVFTVAIPSRWTGGAIDLAVPEDAPVGKLRLEVIAGTRVLDTIPFEVFDRAEEKKNAPDAITWDDDDLSYTKDLLEELRQAAKRDQVPELEEYVQRVEELLQLAEQGELSKEQLLEELQKAKEQLESGAEPDQKEVDQDLADTGKELEKNELTKELGKALQEGDLEKAKKELEKLAEKMDKGELNEKQQQDLAKAMEKAAKAYNKKDEKRQKELDAKIQQAEKELRKLQKEKDEAKSEQQKQDAERRLEKKKRELQQLQKDKEKKEQSEQRRALKRLHKDMDEAAKDLQKKKDPNDQDQEQDGQKSASRKMKDAAEETGRVDKDKRKTATQKKVSSQMDDLREAMRRAKRKGSKGPKNPFGKNGKDGRQSDFERRARGGKGQKGAWKPGQGKGQNGGDGKGDPQETDTYGTGHDEDLVGESTAKSGDTKDEDLQGVHGKGPSRRETILSAAQKGFASKGYEQVYADYKRIVEEVMRNEKVPSSYKYYIKKYFTKIKPHEMGE